MPTVRPATSLSAGATGARATSPSSSSTAILPARTGSSWRRRCFRVACASIGIDWRGCGDSERPKPASRLCELFDAAACGGHARGARCARHRRCHLATHSTGGIIATRMLLLQPQRFGRVLALDPVTPLGMAFERGADRALPGHDAQPDVTRADDGNRCRPRCSCRTAWRRRRADSATGLTRVQALFERIVQQTFSVGEGIWIGTPLNLNAGKGEQRARAPHARDQASASGAVGRTGRLIPQADLRAMAAAMPDCRLVTIPGIGHSMNLEQPALYAGYFGAFFAGQRL